MGLDLNGERFAAKRLGSGPVGITLRASLAVEAVTSEPLSTVNSLLTAKLTGNIAESGLNILLQER